MMDKTFLCDYFSDDLKDGVIVGLDALKEYKVRYGLTYHRGCTAQSFV
jgi:hypothetical protein